MGKKTVGARGFNAPGTQIVVASFGKKAQGDAPVEPTRTTYEFRVQDGPVFLCSKEGCGNKGFWREISGFFYEQSVVFVCTTCSCEYSEAQIVESLYSKQ